MLLTAKIPFAALIGRRVSLVRVRFCDSCKKNVYNVSAMTRAEALMLVQRNEVRNRNDGSFARSLGGRSGSKPTRSEGPRPAGVASERRRLLDAKMGP